MISPYVRRLRLAAELRELRADAGLTHQQLARKTGTSRSQISRLENAYTADQSDILKILDALGVDGDHWTRIMRLARDAAERGWWESHRSMGSRQALHANLEAGATTIREFQMTFIPGLMQTPDYAHARMEADCSAQRRSLSPDDVIDGRKQRQRMLHRPDGPEYHAVLDEVMITRLATPPEVTKAQLYNVSATVNSNSKVTVQVLPTTAVVAGYSMPRSAFSIYTFADPDDPTVVVVDTVTEDLVLTDDDNVQCYEHMFRGLSDAALSARESLRLLARTAARTG